LVARKVRRVYQLLLKIFTDGSMTIASYAQTLGVSSRTLQRDVNDLIEIGLPLERNAGTITFKGSKRLGLPDLDLSESNRLFLANLLNLAESYFGELDQDNIRSLRRALSNSFISEKQRNQVLNISNFYYFLNQKQERVKYSILKTLEKAMAENISLFVVYSHPLKNEINFCFEPHSIVFSKSHWYVFGRNVELNARLFYRVSRIDKLMLSYEHFHQLEKDEVERMLSKVWEVHYGEKSYEISVKFAQSSVEKLIETDRHPSQVIKENDDGSVVLTVNVCGYKEFMWWVLSWGNQAEILSPQWIREKMAHEISAMKDIYSINGDK